MKTVKSNTLLLLFVSLFMATLGGCQSRDGYTTVREKEFTELSKKANTVILDVRTPEEFQEGHLANAKLMNYNSGNFQNETQQLDKSKTYLVYCKAGGRSASASAELAKNGFKVYNLDGGISNWTGIVVK